MCEQLSLFKDYEIVCTFCHGEDKYLYLHCEDNNDIYLTCPCCLGQGKFLDVDTKSN